MSDYRVRVGLRDPDSKKYVGEPENWDKAEEACREAVQDARHDRSPRSPARPRSTARRSTSSSRTASAASGSSARCRWTTTCPSGFELEYIGADNQPHRPVMIHRAPFGSLERFIGMLIEHFAGAFPVWLARRSRCASCR